MDRFITEFIDWDSEPDEDGEKTVVLQISSDQPIPVPLVDSIIGLYDTPATGHGTMPESLGEWLVYRVAVDYWRRPGSYEHAVRVFVRRYPRP